MKRHCVLKRVTTIALVFISLAILNSCSKEDNPVIPERVLEDFGIYFLKDTTITIQQVLSGNLSDFELASTPWISSNDIEFYDWSSHCIYLKKDKSNYFPSYQTPYSIPSNWSNRPYIVVANKKPRYVNYFMTLSSVWLINIPYTGLLEIRLYPEDVIASYLSAWMSFTDPRNNDSVKTALIKKGLYHSGLEVSFDTTNPIKVINGDTTTVEYTLWFKNNDSDNLYFFDPDKIDTQMFHFWNNGPAIKSSNYLYESNKKITKNLTSWDSNWYTLLQSGESLKRTIRLKGYATIPNGSYSAQMLYACPEEIPKNVRINSQGRFWLGRTLSNRITITINN